MASIQKRGKKYAVVYTYEDAAGTKRQKWETFSTKKPANKKSSPKQDLSEEKFTGSR